MPAATLWPGDVLEAYSQNLTRVRVIVCGKRKYAVVPGHIHAHLREHHAELDHAVRCSIEAAVTGSGDRLARSLEAVSYPTPDEPPIAGLTVSPGARACTAQQTDGQRCRYACISLKVMKNHCHTVRGWNNPRSRGGRPSAESYAAYDQQKPWSDGRLCQRFFKEGAWLKYFEVSHGASADPCTRG
ncbi:hypothetical protein BDZ85DRAFT_318534 [Elsinoe ampelina]|uniref:Uncharacterized protein n=1 Tax=Elsinoe ampelina TaxID=302913 RepID=A0A6A6GG75_9PEZI|nr:hypothetical protein BDZ85DRAFT_318534 [Elsinoe ampelina]